MRVKKDAAADDLPLPTTDHRERYHDDRHFEHWFSGRRDRQYVIAAAGDLPSTRQSLNHGPRDPSHGATRWLLLKPGGGGQRTARDLDRHAPCPVRAAFQTRYGPRSLGSDAGGRSRTSAERMNRLIWTDKSVHGRRPSFAAAYRGTPEPNHVVQSNGRKRCCTNTPLASFFESRGSDRQRALDG